MKIIPLALPLLHRMPIPTPGADADKNTHGRVMILAGSCLSPGAPLLAGEAALRSGAGKVLVGVPRRLSDRIGLAAPEFGVLGLAQTPDGEPSTGAFPAIRKKLQYCDAILVGPGMVDETNASSLAKKLLAATDRCVVIDAAAIGGLRKSGPLRHGGALPILTPHAGEMAELTGLPSAHIRQAPGRVALQTARKFHCILVLKGAHTHIAHPDGSIWCHSGGNPGLGTAGSGDVLAGLLAGLVTRGTPSIAACLWGVYLHAQAGVSLTRGVGSLGFLARELAPLFPGLMDGSGVLRCGT